MDFSERESFELVEGNFGFARLRMVLAQIEM